MNNRYGWLIGLWLVSQGAMAMQLPPLLEMQSTEPDISLPVKNDSNIGQTFTLTAQEITFPEQGYRVLDKHADALIIFPKSIKLTPGQRGSFHIVTKQRAKQERYFHLNLLETVASPQIAQWKHSSANGKISFPLQVSTNLIVRPEHSELRYEINGRRFHNLSLGYVLLMQDDDCGKIRGTTQVIAPGHWATLAPRTGKRVVSVGFVDQIKIIENQCS